MATAINAIHVLAAAPLPAATGAADVDASLLRVESVAPGRTSWSSTSWSSAGWPLT
jgi:hypothetical protein